MSPGCDYGDGEMASHSGGGLIGFTGDLMMIVKMLSPEPPFSG